MRTPLAPLENLCPELQRHLENLSKLPYAERRKILREPPNSFPLLVYRYLKPDICRNYLDAYLLDSFFWLSSPADFNDPFDMNANLTLGNDPAALRKRYVGLAKTYMPSANRQMRRQEVAARMRQPTRELSNNKSFLDKHTQEIGVLCFSEESLNLLMWSHYADQHKGFALQFDVARDVKTMLRISKVDYSNSFPLIDYSALPTGLEAVFLRKHPGWMYECEWRMIIPNGAKTYLEFKPEIVTALIFGCRASIELKKKVCDVLAKRALQKLGPIKIFQTVKHESEYRLQIQNDKSLRWPS